MGRFDRTARAIKAYDKSAVARERLWAKATTDLDVTRCIKRDNEALAKVREAFALDTADCNSRAHAFLADLGFMRGLSGS